MKKNRRLNGEARRDCFWFNVKNVQQKRANHLVASSRDEIERSRKNALTDSAVGGKATQFLPIKFWGEREKRPRKKNTINQGRFPRESRGVLLNQLWAECPRNIAETHATR